MSVRTTSPEPVPIGASGSLVARDALGREIALNTIRLLLERIVVAWRPQQIWLFGSRARGEAQVTSDWDLFAVVPDNLTEDELGPLASWRLSKGSGARADIFPCHASEFREERDTPNTLAYEVAREGVLLYER
jgi:predicted nucleotidyltransferase